MRIKNWVKTGPHGNCWKLRVRTKPYSNNKICIRKGYSGDWLLASERTILRRDKTKAKIYEKAITWMRRHPNG